MGQRGHQMEWTNMRSGMVVWVDEENVFADPGDVCPTKSVSTS